MFKSTEIYNIVQMTLDNILFVNFYSSLIMSNYKITTLPGKIEGVNGSVFGGFIIGINKNIKNEKKTAAFEVLKYFFSEQFQREVIVKHLHLITSLTKLYDDDEICSYINCEMMKEIQFYLRPSATMKNYESFSRRTIKYFYEYLNGEKTAEETLSNIYDITYIYYFSYHSTIGLIMFIYTISLLHIIIFTMSFLFIPKLKKYFSFLSLDLWIVYSLGSILMVLSCFLYFNGKTKKKCTYYYIMSELGNGLVYIPIIYKLLINFPKKNKYSELIKRKKYIFILFLLSIYFILFTTIILSDLIYVRQNIDINNKNYLSCSYNYNNKLGTIMIHIQYFFNISLYLTSYILLFLEWNISETFYDIRHFSFVMIMDGINQLIIIILYYVNLNNYILHGVVHISINSLFVIVNQIYVFIIRIIILSLTDTNEITEEEFISNLKRFNVSSTDNKYRKGISVQKSEPISDSSENSTSFSNRESENSGLYKSKFISYHFSTSHGKKIK